MKNKFIFIFVLLGFFGCKEEQYTIYNENAGDGLSCNFGTQNLINGATTVAYQSPSVLKGGECVSEVRTCNDGSLTGNYQYESCVVMEDSFTNDCGGPETVTPNPLFRSPSEMVSVVSQPNSIKTIGDGWDVTFHTSNPNYLFNVYHHGSGKILECWNRLDPDGSGPLKQADRCSAKYPFDFGLGSTLKSSAWMNSKDELWIAGQNTKVACVNILDITNPELCENSPYVVSGSTGVTSTRTSNSILVDDRLYWINAQGTNLSCFNTDNRTSCISDNFTFGSTSDGELLAIDHKIYMRVGSLNTTSSYQIKCYDTLLESACEEWNDNVTPSSGIIIPHMDQSAAYDGICTKGTCWFDNGTEINTVNPFDAVGWTGDSGSSVLAGKMTVTSHGRVYMHYTLREDPQFKCFDYTTNAPCAGFENPANYNNMYRYLYTSTQDPYADACIWTNADPKQIGVFSLNGGTDLSGCAFWSGCSLPE